MTEEGKGGDVTYDLGTTATARLAHPGYWDFYDTVAALQVGDWLRTTERGTLLDLSGGDGGYALRAAAAGHTVMHLGDPDGTLPGVQVVAGDAYDLGWVADGSVDAVLAERGALSAHLAAEHTFGQLHRVLRPGGRLLMCVESLVLGLARLADQGRWAELADAPSADVVLVPNDDGSISRCFWPEELEGVLADFGFDVEWVRPRTVLSQEAVTRALAQDPASFDTLVETELSLAVERQGESTGIHLVAAARRR